MNFREKITDLKYRENIVKHKKFKPKPEASHLVKYKNELDYEYYICDYCGKEIRINNKWEDSKGGICKIPSSLTGGFDMKLTLHNKCVNYVIDVFINMQRESENDKHIPKTY